MSDFAELHDELRSVARDLLAKSASPPWSTVVDAGWPGLEVPEAHDGAGATFAETAVVLEELGRAAASTPLLGAVLAVGALATGEQHGVLSAVARGEHLVTLVMPAGDVAGAAFRAERRSGAVTVDGTCAYVPDAGAAEQVLLLASLEGSSTVALVDAAALAIEPTETLDASRSFGTVTAIAVEVDPDRVWPVDADRLAERAALAVAIDSLGVAEAMLDATVAYVKVREQFDRPIGSFQAVKHACADMLVTLSIGRELVSAAVAKVAAGEPAGTEVSMAKSFMGAAAVDVAGKAMQLHGGIGYTWESPVHRYLKRAVLNRSLYGSPVAHRRRIASRLLAR